MRLRTDPSTLLPCYAVVDFRYMGDNDPIHEGRPAAPDEARLGFGARSVAAAKKAAVDKVRGEVKDQGWRALVALITGWFVRALPAIALSGVVGTVAGTVAGHVAGKAAAKSSSAPADAI